MDAARRLLRRYLTKEQRRFIKFCIVGASGVPVNLLFTWLGHDLLFRGFVEPWRKGAAFTLGIMLSILTNFLLNDLWTWGDVDGARHGVWGRLLRFYLVCSVASGIQFGAAMALSLWLGVHYLLAQLVGIALATVVNYVVNNVWTFRSAQAPPPVGEADDQSV